MGNILKQLRSRETIIGGLFVLATVLLLGLATAKLPVLLPLGGVVLAGLALFTYRSPFLALLVITFFLPFERIGSYDVAGITVRPSQILALILIVVWFLHGVINRNFRTQKNPIVIPLIAFLLINLVSLTGAANIQRSILVFAFTLFTIGFSLLIPNYVTDEVKLRRVIRILLITTTLVALFGLWQFFGDMIGLPTTLTGLREHYTKIVFGFPRIQSTALEPLYFANFLLIPIAVIYALLISRSSSIKMIRLLPLLILTVLNLVLTVSRGGYLGVIVIILVVSFVYLRKIFRWQFLVSLVVGIVVVWFFAIRALGFGDVFQLNAETFLTHIVDSFSGPAYTERIETFQWAEEAWRANPIIGIGPGQYGPFVSSHPYIEPKEGWKIVNNEFIELLAETGVLGLAAFLVVIGSLVIRSLKAIVRARTPYLRALMTALLAALLGILAQYMTFSILYIMHVWFLIGLMVAVQNIILNPAVAAPEPKPEELVSHTTIQPPQP